MSDLVYLVRYVWNMAVSHKSLQNFLQNNNFCKTTINVFSLEDEHTQLIFVSNFI